MMTIFTLPYYQAALRLIQSGEGKKDRVYKDSKEIWSIGYGRNVQTRDLYPGEAEYLLHNDMERNISHLSTCKCWNGLNDNRKAVLIDMAMMGIDTLFDFTEMFKALDAQDWDKAAEELKSSAYYKEVGQRGVRNYNIMKTGKL